MAWEKRERGGTYYTRSRREGRRVVREYIGTGATAELIAQANLADQQQAQLVKAQEQAERERIAAVDAQIAIVEAVADAALRSALAEAGYHQHNRGAWRKRREGKENDGNGKTDS